MRWTGNGLADGTVITAANVNAPGNGATVTFSAAGTGTITTEGYGFRVRDAASTGIRRLDAAVSGTGERVQVGITPGEFPDVTATFVAVRTSSAAQVSLLLNTDGSIQISANGVVAASKTPVVAAGDTLLIDLVVAQHTSPTTSNGRVFYRVRNLTNTSWATGGEFFYDSGYTRNIGTSAYASIRYGKMSTEVIGSTGILYEHLGWEPISVSTADTSREQAEAYFLAPAVIAVTATGGVTLGGSSVAGSPAGGGSTVTATGVMVLAGTASHRTVTGMVGLIGDSTLWQDGNGEARMKAKLLPKGYTDAQVGYYANIGKPWFTADSNGKTVPQNISDIRAALGGDPDVWLFNLGANGSGRTEAQVRSDIDIAFDNVPAGTHRLLFVGLSQADGATNAATRQQWNSYAKPRVEERGGEWLDWYTYQKSIGDAGLWQADNVHMTNHGYDIKNTFMSNAIGPSELSNYREAPAGLTLSGTATAFARVSVSAAGAFGMSGTATAVGFETITANGSLTLTLTGSAASVARELRTASATLTLTGTATVPFREARDATGGLVLTGTTGTVTRHTRTAVGTLTATGYATGYARPAQQVYLGDTPVTLKIGDHPIMLH